MPKTRVLIVDDSVVFRHAVSGELARDPDLEVAGTAPNGRIGLAKVTQVNPDVIILDINMPEMDGLAMLKELRKTHRRLPVIMFSTLTERGAMETLDALAAGATDYFAKPASAGGLEASLRVIRDDLIPRIKAVAAPKAGAASGAGAPRPASPTPPPRVQARPAEVRVLAIGCSTGGPNALTEIFARLPADLPVPILIVQHMPPVFTRFLAERLTAQSKVRVREAVDGTVLEPGEAWVAPGDYHMTVVRDGTRRRLALNQGPPENSCRPAADVLLRSLPASFGPDTLTVILTGMGQDGLQGCRVVREAGGQILAQDEATSVVWGMPGAVARAELVDSVVPLPFIANEILNRVKPRP